MENAAMASDAVKKLLQLIVRLERIVAHAYLGAIAILIFGMKMTSEALQKMAGPYADALVARAGFGYSFQE